MKKAFEEEGLGRVLVVGVCVCVLGRGGYTRFEEDEGCVLVGVSVLGVRKGLWLL